MDAPNFRGLVELSSESMAVLDLEGRVVAVNAALVLAVGDAPAGSDFSSLLRPEDRPAWREAWARLGTGARVSVTARGASCELAFAWTLQQVAADQAVYVVGQPQEVQQRGAAIHLEVLRSVVANLPLVLFAADTRGEVVLLEGQGLAAIGLTPLEANGARSAFEVFRGIPPLCDGIRRALAGAALRGVFEFLDRHFETWTAPLHDEQGRLHGAIGLASDVTEAVNSGRRLRELNEKLEAEAVESPARVGPAAPPVAAAGVDVGHDQDRRPEQAEASRIPAGEQDETHKA